MPYPKTPNLKSTIEQIDLYAALKHEYGAKNIQPILRELTVQIRDTLKQIKALPVDKELAKQEPNDLSRIRALRPNGPRQLWTHFDENAYLPRLSGALLGRMAGCTLGAMVEGWPIEQMEALADKGCDDFPPTDYWSAWPVTEQKRYEVSPYEAYSRAKMDGVPVDDDIVYTLLGLLIVEDYGPQFTTENVGRAWLKYLPYACTAEEVALRNLRAGVTARKAADKDNPYCEWIGADIRSDPWGYLAPGYPELAAEFAWRDAYLSHRRQGIYGAMFFSATIAAAFAVDDPIETLKIGLTEIPKDCALAKAVHWALAVAPRITNYKEARTAVDAKFAGMNLVHTINNACLTVFGITIGGTDFTRVIGETVAMGLDNDCTAATAGSIVGAVVGKSGIPKHWHRRFNNTVHSYLIGHPQFAIDDIVARFAEQAKRILRIAPSPRAGKGKGSGILTS